MQTMTAPFSSIRVVLASRESQKALASVKVADSFFLTGMRVVEGKNGLFVSMPSKKDPAGQYHDLFFPASREIRDQLQHAVLAAYREELAKAAALENEPAIAA
jgi:stage V sporulation protein G